MKRFVHREGTVSVIVFRQQFPSLTVLAIRPQVESGCFDLMVRLVTGVYRPAHAVQLKDKRAGIHIAMANSSPSSFSTEVIFPVIISTPAEDHDRIFSIAFPCKG